MYDGTDMIVHQCGHVRHIPAVLSLPELANMLEWAQGIKCADCVVHDNWVDRGQDNGGE